MSEVKTVAPVGLETAVSRPLAHTAEKRRGNRELAASSVGAALSIVTALNTWHLLSPGIPPWLRFSVSVLGGMATLATVGLISGAMPNWSWPKWRVRLPLSSGSRTAALWSALACIGVAALMPALGPLGALRTGLTAIGLMAPGYLLSLLLVPESAGGLGRLVVTWALSAGLVPLPLAVLNAAGAPFSLGSTLACLLLLIAVLTLGVKRVQRRPFQLVGTQAADGPMPNAERLLLCSAILLTILLAVLPYVVQHSYFPFGRDYQHPINVEYLLNKGHPWPQPAYVHRTYPDSYGYLAAALAVITGWTPLQVLKVLPVLSLIAGALSVYWATRGIFGRRVAAFTLFAYSALSFQPRSNFFAGTYIDLISGITFVPLYFWCLVRTMQERSYRTPLLAGLLLGFMIQYHLFTLTYSLAISVLALMITMVLRRELVMKGLAGRLAVLSGVAFVIGLPYSVYYSFYYVQNGLARLGATGASLYNVDFPSISFPQDFVRIGLCYLLLPVAGLILLSTGRVRLRRPRPAGILLSCWLVVLLIGAFTKIFVDPLRPTYLLALPAAALLGLLADAAAKGFADPRAKPGIGWRGIAGLTAMAVVAAGMLLSLPFVANLSAASAADSRFAETRDLSSLQALRQVWQAQGKPNVVTDESGLWADYYTDGQADVVPGGPAGFSMWYPSQQERYRAFWAALQSPCSPEGLDAFRAYGVRLIYLGRRPQHWVKPGYEYNDGSGFLDCPGYTVVYSEGTPEGPIHIFRVNN